MENLPKIVAAKLAHGVLLPNSASHPDPDLLTAFLERSLPKRERGEVMAHLASCALCREVVALAQPELYVDASVLIPKPIVSRGFLLRWGALAACAVLAVTLVLRTTKNTDRPLAVADKRASEAAVTPSAAVPSAPDASPGGNEVLDRLEPKAAQVPARRLSKTASPSPASLRASKEKFEARLPEITGGVPQLDDRKQAGVQHEEPVAANPSASGQLAAKGQSFGGSLNSEAGKLATPAPAEKKADMARADQLSGASVIADKKKEDTPSGAAGGAAIGASSQVVEVTSASQAVEVEADKDGLHASSEALPLNGRNMSQLSVVRQVALWQITAAGELQRSFDSGKSWESVSLGQPVRLRVTAVSSLHVWAGGNEGVLFHSRDGGDHFMSVAVKDARTSVTGDIVVLDFADAKHGRLETAGHEVWTTSNGGKTWRKQ